VARNAVKHENHVIRAVRMPFMPKPGQKCAAQRMISRSHTPLSGCLRKRGWGHIW